MADSPEFERFTQLYRLTQRMIEDVDKECLANVARMLAINVAHYQSKYGMLPMEESVALLHAETISDEQAKMLADGMENLAAVLAIADGKDDFEVGGKIH